MASVIGFEVRRKLFQVFTLTADLSAQGIDYANSLDTDQAQQNVGLDLRSNLFDYLIIILKKMRKKKNHVFQLILRYQFIANKLPSKQRDKQVARWV